MSNLSLRHIYKVYPNGVKAVNDFNMEIEDKEFIVFVGPSGCGKSTTLRMIAGLEEITAGELYIGDTLVNRIEPKDRDIAMVFQNYALYPHMTVYENLAFGLKLRHVPQAEIHKRVLWAAKILKIEEYLERKPKALSGGQRQRVSLGRAILRTPKVFLLDEPLSNLDAKLRTEMRAEIAKLHNEIQTTFIYVTHDQVEAMTMGTRIVVMSMGYVQQIDTPQNLYNYPENKFVAGFIGTPQMNFFTATLKREGDKVNIAFEGTDNVLTVPFQSLLKVRPEYLNGDLRVIVGLRCEHISADADTVKNSKNVVKVKITHFEELGDETLIYGDMDMTGDGLSDTNTRVIVKQYGGGHTTKIGDIINVAFDMERAHFFDEKTEKTIAPRIPEENVFDVVVNGSKLTVLGSTVNLPKAVADQVADCSKVNATMIIPTDALYEGGEDIKATVVCQEEIKGVRITHLKLKNRTFFMLGGGEHAADEEISLGIDFKRISIEGDVTVKPLPTYDTFYGSYFDRTNAKRSVSYLIKYYNELKKKELAELNKKLNEEISEFIFQDSMMTAIKEEYANKRKEILGNKSYRLGTESLGKEGKKKVEAEAREELAKAKAEYDAKVAEFKSKKEQFDRLPEADKATRKSRETEVRAEYKKVSDAIEAKYTAIVKDIEKNIPNVEKQLLPMEQANAAVASKSIAEVNAEYAQIKTETAARLDGNIAKAQADVATLIGVDKDNAVIALKEAKRAKIDGLALVKSQHNAAVDDVMFQSKVFVAYINGQPFLTSLDINKKIIKGLGAQLFLSHYRFEVPHNAYTVGNEGIELKVLDIIDYGNYKYAKCDLYGNVVYVEIDKDIELNSTIKVAIDVEQSKIYENLFDIRLY